MKTQPIFRLMSALIVCSLFFSACIPHSTSTPTVSPSPSPTPGPTESSEPSSAAIDDWLGPYAPERLWGNPREAINPDGWSFSYDNAITTSYRTGEDGIAALTDQDMNALVNWAFFVPGQSHLTERLYGLTNAEGQYGETILETRFFKENTPTHSYMNYVFLYPYQDNNSEITIEYAKLDGRSVVAQLTVAGVGQNPSPLTVVPEIISRTGGQVVRNDDNTLVATFNGGAMVLVAETMPNSWQITSNSNPGRAKINDAIVRNQVLSDSGSGNKAAWQYTLNMTSGSDQIIRFGIGYAANVAVAVQRAKNALASADSTLATRKVEADELYVNDVTAHQEVYQAALMNLLWNEMYYQYNGFYQPQYQGTVDLHDVLIVPDKWEFPWIAMWDSCFQSKAATLADINQSKHDLSLLLSDRWQNASGHIPGMEWDLSSEMPPLFAWAVWQVYQTDGDRTFLEQLFPRLEAHYTYTVRAFDPDSDHLFAGGFMGMDNLPRPGGSDEEDADLSGWMAFFALHMKKIATELGQTDRANYYTDQYTLISDAINAQLWDASTGFYYDRNANGLLVQKSYSGLIPFIAGVGNPTQTEEIMSALSDPNQLWSDFGIRSLSAQSSVYEPGYSVTGWKNSNWRGPVWIPINYLLVQRVEEVDPALGDQLRENLINNIESNWRTTGHFYEYYNSATGQGIGADHQTGWTALVANLIYEKYHR